MSKGILPNQLTDHLEKLLPLEHEVLLARAAGESLRQLGGRLELTAEGVRQIERRALRKLQGEGSSVPAQGQHFRQAVEQRFGVTLEEAVKRLPRSERKLVLAYAKGESLADLAPTLELSIEQAMTLRDRLVSRLLGEERGSRAGRWLELKASVVVALTQTPLTYDELEKRFPMSRRRLMKLMLQLVDEGRAELTDEYPFRFFSVEKKQARSGSPPPE